MSHSVPGGITLPPFFSHRNPPSTLVYGNGALAKLEMLLKRKVADNALE